MQWILSFLPEEAYPLVIAGLGLGLMIGLVSRSTVLGVLGGLLTSILLGPVIEAVMEELPGWVLLLGGLVVLRQVLAPLRRRRR